MRVFVTGATGFIGRAVVADLLQAGHQVLGLSRSDAGERLLEKLGAKVHRGSLEDLDSLKQGALATDGVIHLAFSHDFTNLEAGTSPMDAFAKCCATDRAAIETMATALIGTNKPLLMTSGTLALPNGELATEDSTPALTSPLGGLRGPIEGVALAFASKGVRVSVVRLPPTNHGDGDAGFVAGMISAARAKGVSAYIGDGSNCWPAVHRLDTARVFRLALEKGTAGSIYHAVAEERVTIKAIAEAIGRELGIPAVGMSLEEAQKHLGFYALGMAGDNPTSSAKTRAQLGWEPEQVTLLEDLKVGTYFK